MLFYGPGGTLSPVDHVAICLSAWQLEGRQQRLSNGNGLLPNNGLAC